MNQRKCLQSQLEKQHVGLTSLLPGVYDKEQLEYMNPEQPTDAIKDFKEFLDLCQIAETIVKELLNP